MKVFLLKILPCMVICHTSNVLRSLHSSFNVLQARIYVCIIACRIVKLPTIIIEWLDFINFSKLILALSKEKWQRKRWFVADGGFLVWPFLSQFIISPLSGPRKQENHYRNFLFGQLKIVSSPPACQVITNNRWTKRHYDRKYIHIHTVVLVNMHKNLENIHNKRHKA